MKQKIKAGDFIQLNTWFADVWAEVTDSFGDSIKYINYSKGGLKRWECYGDVANVRSIIAKEEVESKIGMLITGVLHSNYEYFGSGHKHWNHPIEKGKYRSAYPEHYAED